MDSDNSHVRTAYAERLERRGDEDNKIDEIIDGCLKNI